MRLSGSLLALILSLLFQSAVQAQRWYPCPVRYSYPCAPVVHSPCPIPGSWYCSPPPLHCVPHAFPVCPPTPICVKPEPPKTAEEVFVIGWKNGSEDREKIDAGANTVTDADGKVWVEADIAPITGFNWRETRAKFYPAGNAIPAYPPPGAEPGKFQSGITYRYGYDEVGAAEPKNHRLSMAVGGHKLVIWTIHRTHSDESSSDNEFVLKRYIGSVDRAN